MRYSVGSGLAPKCRFRSIRTCCDMAAAMRWPTRATTRGRCRRTSGTRTSSTRCATPNSHRIASRTSGANVSGGRPPGLRTPPPTFSPGHTRGVWRRCLWRGGYGAVLRGSRRVTGGRPCGSAPTAAPQRTRALRCTQDAKLNSMTFDFSPVGLVGFVGFVTPISRRTLAISIPNFITWPLTAKPLPSPPLMISGLVSA
jgi:hypothetical protein